ncbi:hypothetical protein ATANTOWER_031589 [Ataeniobius toweri]|uniref:Uncharacterized protein n=1 Tax=Ataeniobius toweri TaxID=208326 RepID=A0ABU7AC23_9TELE|nr:hypothetical protein [Ataeniobius toweri]
MAMSNRGSKSNKGLNYTNLRLHQLIVCEIKLTEGSPPATKLTKNGNRTHIWESGGTSLFNASNNFSLCFNGNFLAIKNVFVGLDNIGSVLSACKKCIIFCKILLPRLQNIIAFL